jgi:imidazolonepropionase
MQAFLNINQLIGCETKKDEFEIIVDAFLIVDNGIIIAYDSMKQWHIIKEQNPNIKITDVTQKSILPTWCDSHTHLVFAVNREDEFVLKLQGKTYAEIAASGGGILNSAKKIAEISFNDLYDASAERLKEVIDLGTGAIEIKSGYGLNIDGELKMLRVIQKLKENFAIPLKSTFLGAHALPDAYKNKKEDYVNHIINDMLPLIAAENLADYVDVFCEQGFFSNADTLKIATAALKYNMPLKLHANQLSNTGAVETGIAANAISVDHLEQLGHEQILALQNSYTIPVALPAAAQFLQLPYPPARAMLNANLPLAIATDYNPGSAPSGNMHYTVSLACIAMRMLPIEAIKAATLNGAKAMQLNHKTGSIAIGKMANFIITKNNYTCNTIPYKYGHNFIHAVYINGECNK